MADDTRNVVGAARRTVQDYQERWHKLTQEAGQNVGDYVNDGFDYLQSILDDDTGPRDWLKDGVAMWIHGYVTARGLWRSAYQAVFPGDRD